MTKRTGIAWYSPLLITVALASLLTLAACDTADPADDDQGPTAIAGADQTVSVGTTVALDGSNSSDPDGDDLTYSWTFTNQPSGSSATFSNATSAATTFVPDVAGAYTVRLTVSANGKQATDDVRVTAEAASASTITIDEDITQDRTLEDIFQGSDVPDYLVTADVRIDGAQLTVQPGVVIAFAEAAGLTVQENGSLHAVGTATDRIVFTGTAQQPGYWYGLVIRTRSEQNVFDHVDVRYGGGNEYANLTIGWLDEDDARVQVTNSTFTYSGAHGIWVEDAGRFTSFASNTFDHNAKSPLYLPAHRLGTLDGASDYGTDNGEGSHNYVEIYATTIEQAATWHKLNVPYLFVNEPSVEAAVTVEAGATIQFAEGSGLMVQENGSLNAVGTASEPITFTGFAQQPGYWSGLVIRTASSQNVFDHVDLGFGGGNGYGNLMVGWLDEDGAAVTVSNSTIHDSSEYGVYVEGGTYTEENVTYADNVQGDVYQD